MNVTYFKRYKMEIDLWSAVLPPLLPEGFSWVPWDPALLSVHAEVKYQCFLDEVDAVVFPNLATRQGCSYLMSEICKRPGFVSEATWLIACAEGHCGTVQGVRERTGVGAIQNLGIVSCYRGRGLGEALLLKALEGFRRAGLGRAVLEVTAKNEAAVRLYRKIGFRCRKSVYKAVDVMNALHSVINSEW
jgi:ribosomal protein S18 acetylase RimI-like enzyme